MLTAFGVVAAVFLAQAEPESILSPGRRGGMFFASAQVMGAPGFSFAELAPAGVSVLGEAVVGWAAPFPLLVQARAWPLGFTTSTPNRPNTPSFGVTLEALLDLPAFAVGLGVGAANYVDYLDYSQGVARSAVGVRLNGVMRFGVRDGLNVLLRLHLTDVSYFQFSGFEASVQVPLTRSLGMTSSFRYAGIATVASNLGVRVAASEDLFLSVAVGALRIDGRDGPSLEFGVEFRR